MSEIEGSSASYGVMLVAATPTSAPTAEPSTSDTARQDAVRRLYRDEYRGLARLAYLLVHDGHRADDLAHDAFAHLFERWDELRDPSKALAYLRATVVNLAHSSHRRQQTAERHGAIPLASLGAVDATSAEEEAMGRVDRGDVLAALGTLSDRQRAAVVLRHWLRLTEGEIAEALSCSVGSVRTHLARGHAALATRLEALR